MRERLFEELHRSKYTILLIKQALKLGIGETDCMEKLVNHKYNLYIDHIYNISGSDQKFEIFFTSKTDRCRYKLVFDYVFDMRYSIENGFIERFFQLKKNKSENLTLNSMYIVENSEYVRFFHEQSSYTREKVLLKDYIIFDDIDTVVELISAHEPILVKI